MKAYLLLGASLLALTACDPQENAAAVAAQHRQHVYITGSRLPQPVDGDGSGAPPVSVVNGDALRAGSGLQNKGYSGGGSGTP